MKKIKYEDAAFLRSYKKPHWVEKWLCNWFIDLKNPNAGIMKLCMKRWIYVILFIPMHLITFGCCLWDGGIKDFEIISRMMSCYTVTGLTSDNDKSTYFGRFKMVWEKYKNEKDY